MAECSVKDEKADNIYMENCKLISENKFNVHVRRRNGPKKKTMQKRLNPISRDRNHRRIYNIKLQSRVMRVFNFFRARFAFCDIVDF